MPNAYMHKCLHALISEQRPLAVIVLRGIMRCPPRLAGAADATRFALSLRDNTTPRGFEPLRAEPNGFRVHLLSRSDTVSCFR